MGVSWNFNSQAMVAVGEKSMKTPNLMVLSSLGVLVVFQFYNFHSGYSDMTQLTETMPDSGNVYKSVQINLYMPSISPWPNLRNLGQSARRMEI